MRLQRHPLITVRKHSVFQYGLASLLPRGTAILTALLITPFALDRLGVVQYGYWVLATQIPNLIVSPDLGLGQGIINEISREQRLKGGISSYHRRLIGLVKLLFVVALTWLLIGALAILAYVEFDSPDDAASLNLITALVLGLACFSSGVPATVWSRAQLAQERGHVAVLWEGGGKILTLGLSLLVLAVTPSLPLLVVAYLLPTSIALWLNAFFYVRSEFPEHQRPWSWPGLREAFNSNRHVFRTGKYFVLMSWCYVVGVAVDPYLVNNFLSTADVTFLSVTRRPYEMLPLVVTLYSTSLWPVFSRLHGSGEQAKLRWLTLGIAGAGAMIVACAGAVIILLRIEIYSFLSQDYLSPSVMDLIWVTSQVSAITAVLVFANYLSAVSAIRAQAMIMVVGAILTVVTKVVVLQHGSIHDFISAAALSYLLFIATPILVLTLRTLMRVERREAS